MVKGAEKLNYKLNPNLVILHQAFCQKKSGVVLEGSSRSGKTWSGIDFLVWLCASIHYKGSPWSVCTINIIKETYNSFKTTLFEDFNRRLPDYGLVSPFQEKKDLNKFFLFGNTINLLGADNESVYHGVGSDYFWINESLDVSEQVFNQSEQRCRRFWWMDYNPKTTDHYVYNKICRRSDVEFLRTTFLDNPGIAKQEKRKVLSYEPTHPEDRELIEEERRPHPTNITEGTADDYMWRVYGLGLRSAPEGLIFKNVNWIKEWPNDGRVEKIYYGMDFGYSLSPTALARIAPVVNGKDKRLYIQRLIYQPTESSTQLIPLMDDLVATNQIKKSADLFCDSEGDEMITGLRKAGWRALGVPKYKGSIKAGIALLKRYKIYIVKHADFEREQANYKWREINGIRLEEPIDDFNHLWDACRYAALPNLRHE